MDKLVFENVNKSFGKVKALSNLSLSIKEHELLVILGESGSGKTTLLRIISGLEGFDDGEITLDGKPLNSIDIKERKTALVFQNYALYPQMSAYQNLILPLKQKTFYKPVLKKDGSPALEPDYEQISALEDELYSAKGLPDFKMKKKSIKEQIKSLKKNPSVPLFAYQSLSKDEIETRLERVKEVLELDSFLSQRTSTLSGGQKQRVALGKALLKEPDILLLDEPMSNLDAKLRASSRELIRKVHKKANSTTIISSHDQNDAFALADRVCILKDGKVAQIGTIDEVYDDPNNIDVASYLGNPSINLIDVVFDGKNIVLEDGQTLGLKEETAELLKERSISELTVGIRPEHFLLGDEGLKVKYVKTDLLGREFVHRFLLGQKEISIRNRTKLDKNADNIRIKCEESKIILFDRISGEKIR